MFVAHKWVVTWKIRLACNLNVLSFLAWSSSLCICSGIKNTSILKILNLFKKCNSQVILKYEEIKCNKRIIFGIKDKNCLFILKYFLSIEYLCYGNVWIANSLFFEKISWLKSSESCGSFKFKGTGELNLIQQKIVLNLVKSGRSLRLLECIFIRNILILLYGVNIHPGKKSEKWCNV